MEEGQIIPILKPGKENSNEASKFRPISLLDIGGKVLEKLIANRITHHIFSKGLMNTSQFGFTSQKSTIDAAMALKKFVEKNLEVKKSFALVNLDMKGASDAAWWPAILNALRELKCPKNLYDLSTN